MRGPGVPQEELLKNVEGLCWDWDSCVTEEDRWPDSSACLISVGREASGGKESRLI